MTKQEIIQKLSEGIGLQKSEVTAVVEGFVALIMDSVSAGDKVELRRFGVWKPIKRKGRHIRMPDGSGEMDIPDHQTVIFVPSAEFREKLNKAAAEEKAE